ncbi:MAG TPA: site-specific integrase [Candidatus Blautia excrementigallinarum]|nr:site-specific integrase [Candidatus Blautia excrementigallinarum]
MRNTSQYDRIRTGEVTDVAEMEKKLRYRKIEMAHPYKIYYNAKREAWITPHPLDYKKRIQRKTKEALLEALEPLVLDKPGRKLTMSDIYPDWLEYKIQITDSPNTIDKHEQHWHKYFEGTPLFLKPIGDITVEDLMIWGNSLVKKHDLTSNKWQTIKTIPKGIFQYAYMKQYISDNIFDNLRITVKFRQPKKKISNSQIFTNDEYEAIINDLWTSFEKKKSKNYLAVLLNFMLGLRVGELTALQWSDICGDYIYVHQEITLLQNTELLNKPNFLHQFENGSIKTLPNQENQKYQYVLVNHTKTHAERYVPLVPEAQKIIETLRALSPDHRPNDFLFEQNGKNLTIRGVNSVLEYACKHIGIEPKRSHAVRRTVASRLSAVQYSPDGIRDILGHQDLATTMKYLYDPQTSAEQLEKMQRALHV